MINDKIHSKLTPSAKEALNELVEEYRVTLLEKAYTIAEERDTANKEISLRDILETQQPPLKEIRKVNFKEYRKKRWILLISLTGAVYAGAGILIYLFQNKKFSLDNDLGLIVAIMGILISFIAFIYGQMLSKRYLFINTSKSNSIYSNADNYEIVKRWQIIETLAKKFMSEADKNDTTSNSVSFLIRFLSHKIAKNEKEFLKIRELLWLRNKVLHENYELSNTERKEYLEFSDDLIERLELAQIKTNYQEKTLKVISAIYGTSKRSLEATAELNQLIKNNRLEFIANNEIVGDPDPGTIKQLTITYEISGKSQVKTFKEGEKVIIEG